MRMIELFHNFDFSLDLLGHVQLADFVLVQYLNSYFDTSIDMSCH